MLSAPSYAQTQAGPPLNEAEKREIVEQLRGYGRCLDLNAAHVEFIKQETELYQREREIAMRELAVAGKERDIAIKERDIEKTRADFFEQAYKQAMKKRGWGCFWKKLRTFGLGTCG